MDLRTEHTAGHPPPAQREAAAEGRTGSPGGPGALGISLPQSLPRGIGPGPRCARPGPARPTHLNQPDTFLSRLSLGGLYSSSLMERGSILPGPQRARPAGQPNGAGALPPPPAHTPVTLPA